MYHISKSCLEVRNIELWICSIERALPSVPLHPSGFYGDIIPVLNESFDASNIGMVSISCVVYRYRVVQLSIRVRYPKLDTVALHGGVCHGSTYGDVPHARSMMLVVLLSRALSYVQYSHIQQKVDTYETARLAVLGTN